MEFGVILLKKRITIIFIICLVIDRISKIFIMNNFTLYNSKKIISNFFDITYVKNSGAAWSIFSGNRFFLIAIAFLALILFVIFLIKEKNITFFESIIYGLIISGIIGNMIDRIIYGYVIDFLDFNILGYDFPIFNFADVFIVLGAFLYLLICFKRSGLSENNN